MHWLPLVGKGNQKGRPDPQLPGGAKGAWPLHVNRLQGHRGQLGRFREASKITPAHSEAPLHLSVFLPHPLQLADADRALLPASQPRKGPWAAHSGDPNKGVRQNHQAPPTRVRVARRGSSPGTLLFSGIRQLSHCL